MDLTCPKCQGSMRSYERSGIIVDQCNDCRGIFLDRGELERLVDVENAYHAPPAAAPAPAAPAPAAPAPPVAAYGSPQGERGGERRYEDDYRYEDRKRYDDRKRDDDDDRKYYGEYHQKRKKRSLFEDLFD
jgi:uncharacterized protein